MVINDIPYVTAQNYSDFGIDFTTIISDIGTGIKGIFGPSSSPAPATTAVPTVVTTPVTVPLFHIGNIPITPTRLLVGAAVIGTVIYLSRKKPRRR